RNEPAPEFYRKKIGRGNDAGGTRPLSFYNLPQIHVTGGVTVGNGRDSGGQTDQNWTAAFTCKTISTVRCGEYSSFSPRCVSKIMAHEEPPQPGARHDFGQSIPTREVYCRMRDYRRMCLQYCVLNRPFHPNPVE